MTKKKEKIKPTAHKCLYYNIEANASIENDKRRINFKTTQFLTNDDISKNTDVDTTKN